MDNQKGLNPLFIEFSPFGFFLFLSLISYMNFFLQNNITIVTTQDSYLTISYLRVTLEAFSNVT